MPFFLQKKNLWGEMAAEKHDHPGAAAMNAHAYCRVTACDMRMSTGCRPALPTKEDISFSPDTVFLRLLYTRTLDKTLSKVQVHCLLTQAANHSVVSQQHPGIQARSLLPGERCRWAGGGGQGQTPTCCITTHKKCANGYRVQP